MQNILLWGFGPGISKMNLPRSSTGLAPISLMDAITGDSGWSSVTWSASVVPSSYKTTSDPLQVCSLSLASWSVTRSQRPSLPSWSRLLLIRSEHLSETAPATWPLPNAKVGLQSKTRGEPCFNAESSSDDDTSFKFSWWDLADLRRVEVLAGRYRIWGLRRCSDKIVSPGSCISTPPDILEVATATKRNTILVQIEAQ